MNEVPLNANFHLTNKSFKRLHNDVEHYITLLDKHAYLKWFPDQALVPVLSLSLPFPVVSPFYLFFLAVTKTIDSILHLRISFPKVTKNTYKLISTFAHALDFIQAQNFEFKEFI